MAVKLRVQDMGKIVTVKSRLLRKRLPVSNDKGFNLPGTYDAVWESAPVMRQFTGWLVGFRTVWNGRRHYDYDDGGYFQQMKGIYCALVCLWPDQKPIHVPLEGYVVGGPDPRNPKRWRQQDKEDYREYLRDNPPPRDGKGRFVSHAEES